MNEANVAGKRSAGYKRRLLSMRKRTHATLELLEDAKSAFIPAKYVRFDSWFSDPITIHSVKWSRYDVIGMVEKTPKMFFPYNGVDMSLIFIYNKTGKDVDAFDICSLSWLML